MITNPIIVALDVDSKEETLRLVRELKNQVGYFKIGKQLFTRYGPEIVRSVQDCGGKVFLDLKFHDIPNTVSKAVREIVRLGVEMFTIHTTGGKEMMKGAVQSALSASEEFGKNKPLVLGVTILTSLDGKALKEIGFRKGIQKQVEHLAGLARVCGLDGVVASPQEIEIVRRVLGKKGYVVTPGIRPKHSGKDDQKRIMGPREAIERNADFLVIGRPIISHPNPALAAKDILDEIEKKG